MGVWYTVPLLGSPKNRGSKSKMLYCKTFELEMESKVKFRKPGWIIPERKMGIKALMWIKEVGPRKMATNGATGPNPDKAEELVSILGVLLLFDEIWSEDRQTSLNTGSINFIFFNCPRQLESCIIHLTGWVLSTYWKDPKQTGVLEPQRNHSS